MSERYDCLIVGAGAAGCVMAARLSERPDRSVLLLEAGADIAPRAEPADVLDVYPASYYNPSYFWPDLEAWWRTSADSAASAFSQARVMGGGGSVMGMVALRGTPADYAEWERLGARGWGWSDVLPFYCKLEHDLDFGGDRHGSEGPIPIRRIARDRWPPLSRAIAEFAVERGAAFVEDMNADFRDGFAAVPMSNTEQRRASSGLCHLDATVRARSNLRIHARTHVRRVLFEGTRAVAVEALRGDALERIDAREIIVCAGAVFTPALLQRSGIGAGGLLQAHAIAVRADLPGVGANLQNHPVAFIGLWLAPHARQAASLRTNPSAAWRFSSGLPDCAPGDLYINIQSKTSWSALGERIANISPVLLRPRSRGKVALNPRDREAPPRIEFNFLDHADDLERMRIAFRLGIDIACSRPVQSLAQAVFPVRYGDKLRALNAANRSNALKAGALARLLDAAPVLTGPVLQRFIKGGQSLSVLRADPEQLSAHLRENVAGVFHPAGTCRMGRSTDPLAVVDPAGRVHGLGGLRIADASIMPTIPSGNTYLPTVMVAEKIAAAMHAQDRD